MPIGISAAKGLPLCHPCFADRPYELITCPPPASGEKDDFIMLVMLIAARFPEIQSVLYGGVKREPAASKNERREVTRREGEHQDAEAESA